MLKKIYLVCSLTIFVFLFYPLLFTYFSMDDFFHFSVYPVMESWRSVYKIFGIYKFSERGIAFYRPLSRELIFFVFYKLFGLSTVPYRLLQIAIHLANAILVYKLIFKLTKERFVARFTGFFFLISAANVAVLYYLAGGVQTSLMTTFLLLSCFYFEKYLTSKLKINLYKTYIFNLLALMSFETAVALPFLLLGITIIKSKYEYKQILPSLVLSAIFFLINYFYIGFSSTEAQYSISLSPIKFVNTTAWYTLWAFGLPEMLIDFVGPGLKLNPNLLAFWGRYFVIIFPIFLFLILQIVLYAYFFVRKINKNNLKLITFFIFWFIAILGPFLLLPAHKSTHYLAPALPAFWAAIAIVVNKSKQKYLRIFVFTALVLNATSTKLGEKTYWAVQRGNLAKKVLTQLKSEYPIIPKGAVVYVKNDPNYPRLKGDWGASSTQVSYVLSGDDAVRLLYKDPTIQVLYEDLDKHPESRSRNVINFTARLK